LDHAGDPADGADGEGEHGDIDDEFGDGADVGIVLAMDDVKATDHDGQEGA